MSKISLLQFINLIDEFVNFLEVQLVVLAHNVQCSDVQRGRLAYHYEQYIFTDLHFAHEVLVVHYAHLEGLALAQLVELTFEVREKLVHAAAKTIDKVVGYLLLEHDVRGYVLEDLNIIFKFRKNECLNERIFANVLLSL